MAKVYLLDKNNVRRLVTPDAAQVLTNKFGPNEWAYSNKHGNSHLITSQQKRRGL